MITALDNKYVKLAASLKTQKGRTENGLFLLEGQKLIDEAEKSGFEFVKIFVTDGFADRYVKYADRCDTVSAAVQKKICDSVTPQGISAIAKIKEPRFEKLERLIILENVQDPGNFGTVLRTAESFCFDGVITVGSAQSRFSPKVMRSAMGSALRVPVMHFESVQKAAEFVRQKQIAVYCAVLNAHSEKLSEVKFNAPCAVAVGNEGHGLSEEFVAAFANPVYIPMSGKTESLNAAVAAAVLMWEVYRQTL